MFCASSAYIIVFCTMFCLFVCFDVRIMSCVLALFLLNGVESCWTRRSFLLSNRSCVSHLRLNKIDIRGYIAIRVMDIRAMDVDCISDGQCSCGAARVSIETYIVAHWRLFGSFLSQNRKHSMFQISNTLKVRVCFKVLALPRWVWYVYIKQLWFKAKSRHYWTYM